MGDLTFIITAVIVPQVRTVVTFHSFCKLVLIFLEQVDIHGGCVLTSSIHFVLHLLYLQTIVWLTPMKRTCSVDAFCFFGPKPVFQGYCVVDSYEEDVQC